MILGQLVIYSVNLLEIYFFLYLPITSIKIIVRGNLDSVQILKRFNLSGI